MTDKELEAKYNARPLVEVQQMLDNKDIAGFKAYIAELATNANRYRIHDITAILAMQRILFELRERNMVDDVQPEWDAAQRKVDRVHREQQFRIRSQFWGNKQQNPYE